MKTAFLMVIAAGAILNTGPLQGTWTGNVETPHGDAPLHLTVGPRDSSATFEMTFLDAPIRGSAVQWKGVADTVSFSIPFETNLGPGEFKFSGHVVGAVMSGSYIGTMDGQEMNRGKWSLTRRP